MLSAERAVCAAPVSCRRSGGGVGFRRRVDGPQQQAVRQRRQHQQGKDVAGHPEAGHQSFPLDGGLCFQLGVDGLFVGLVVGLFLCQKLPRQHHVFQRGVLGEEVEVLEHEAEVEALFPHLALPLGGRVGGVPHGLAVHPDNAGVGTLKEIQAAQQRRLARAGRADDRQRLALFQCERDVPENLRLAEILPDARGFE